MFILSKSEIIYLKEGCFDLGEVFFFLPRKELLAVFQQHIFSSIPGDVSPVPGHAFKPMKLPAMRKLYEVSQTSLFNITLHKIILSQFILTCVMDYAI